MTMQWSLQGWRRHLVATILAAWVVDGRVGAQSYDITVRGAWNATNGPAIANDATSDQASVQEAIDYAVAKGGGIIYFPAGTFNFTAPLNIRANGVHLLGNGGESRLTFAVSPGTEYPSINIAPNGGGADITNVSVEKLDVSKNTSLGSRSTDVLAAGIRLNRAYNGIFRDITMSLLGVGIKCDQTGGSNVFENVSGLACDVGIRVIAGSTQGAADRFAGNVYRHCNFSGVPGTSPVFIAKGVFIDGNNVGDQSFSDCYWNYCAVGVVLSGAANGSYAWNFDFSGVGIDYCQNYAMDLNTVGDLRYRGGYVFTCGVRMQAVSRALLSGIDFSTTNSGLVAVEITGGSKEVRVTSCGVKGFSYGCNIVESSNCVISGCTFADNYYYAVLVNAGNTTAKHNVISACVVIKGVTADVSWVPNIENGWQGGVPTADYNYFSYNTTTAGAFSKSGTHSVVAP